MEDIIYKNNLPLKIVHNFPKAEDGNMDKCRELIVEKIEKLASRGFGGIVTNCAFAEDFEVISVDYIEVAGAISVGSAAVINRFAVGLAIKEPEGNVKTLDLVDMIL